MNCPYRPNIQCEYVDTAGMDKIKECNTCEHYPDPIQKLINNYKLEEMLNLLPKTIIKGKKSFFRMSEVFDICITKDAFDNWHVAYLQEMRLHVLYETINPQIKRALAEMMAILIENKYMS